MSTKTYSVFKRMFFPLLNKLEMDYWCTHTGVDGYLYLLFQRRFFKLTMYMSAISIVSQIILYFLDPEYKFSIFGDLSAVTKDSTDMLFQSKYELTTIKSWSSIIIIFMFTLLTIRIVQKTRRDAKVALEQFY